MQSEYHLTKDQVPAHLRGSYNGNKFRAIVTGQVHIPSHAGLWDGGSRTTYSVIDINTGKSLPASDNHSAPWDRDRKDLTVKVGQNIAVVSHSIFCGKDMGLTFYLSAEDVAPLLPDNSSDDLSPTMRLVLCAARSFKSSYNGMDRYDMAKGEFTYMQDAPVFPSRDEWDNAKQALISLRYLNKAGAITPAGRNAIGNAKVRDILK